MRLALAFLALATPAAAWDFRPDPICTLSHQMESAEVTVTFDVSLPEYAISITLAEGTWPSAPVFAIVFRGARDLTIQTDRHERSADGRTLTVRDRGFGNVLDGLEFYGTAIAIAGDRAVPIDLAGSAPEVAAFRACPTPSLS